MSDYADDLVDDEEFGRGINRVADMAEDINEMLEESAQIEADEVDDEDYGVEEDEYDLLGYEAEDEVDVPPSSYRLGEYEIPAEQVEDVVNLLQWASSLSPEQAARINSALAGQEQVAAQQPVEPVEPDAPAFIAELEQTDPTMARYMREMYDDRIARERELEERLAEVMGEVDALESVTGQRLLQETQAEVQSAEQAAREEFLAVHGLDDDDYELLVATAGQLNITNAMVETYGLEEGFYKTLETALYANPELRERNVQFEVESALQENQTASRKEAASGLAPQGGTNLPTSTPAGLPQSERRSAMVRDIEALLGMQP